MSRNQHIHNWTDVRIEQVKKLWNAGHSAGQIAIEIGGVTRNAVIGKVHRLGLSGRGQPKTHLPRSMNRPHRTYVVRARRMVASKPYPVFIGPPQESEPLRLSVLELRDATEAALGTCKWAINDGPGFLFCGHGTRLGSVWCAFHDTRVYNPQTSRRL